MNKHVSNIAGDYKQIPIKDLKPEDYEHHEWLSGYDPDDEVRVYKGDVTVNGDLDLNGNPFYGIIVHGNLKVTGNIENGDYNSGTYLYVTGTTMANNLLSGGGCIALNIAHIRYFTIGFYNDGMLVVNELSTQVLYNLDHCIQVSTYVRVDVSLDQHGYGYATSGVCLDTNGLCEYWYNNGLFTDYISIEEDFDDDDYDDYADNKDLAEIEYGLDDDDIIMEYALNDMEQLMIDELHKYAQEVEKRKADCPDSLISSGVFLGNGKADQITLTSTSDYEEMKKCLANGKLGALRCLVIKALHGDEIDENFDGIPTLEKLTIRNSMLKSIPHWIRHSNNLQELDTSNNSIESIPKWIASLKNLEKLILKDNEIKYLPAGIGKMPSLKTLDVSENPLLMPPLPPSLVKLIKSGVMIIDSDDDNLVPGHIEDWDLASNPFTERCEQIINQYRKVYSDNIKSTLLGEESWPPMSIVRVQSDNNYYMFTSGISNFCQSREYGTAFDPQLFSRIEFALCLEQERLTPELDSEVEHYLLELADGIINQQSVSTPADLNFCHDLKKYPCFEKVFGLVTTYNPPAIPKIELPSFNDERASLLWLIPVTEKELEKPQSNFKKFIQKKSQKDPEYYIVGNQV